MKLETLLRCNWQHWSDAIGNIIQMQLEALADEIGSFSNWDHYSDAIGKIIQMQIATLFECN